MLACKLLLSRLPPLCVSLPECVAGPRGHPLQQHEDAPGVPERVRGGPRGGAPRAGERLRLRPLLPGDGPAGLDPGHPVRPGLRRRGRTGVCVDGRTGGHTQTDRRVDGWADGWLVGMMDEWMALLAGRRDGQAGG